jgi:hypothetical protein
VVSRNHIGEVHIKVLLAMRCYLWTHVPMVFKKTTSVRENGKNTFSYNSLLINDSAYLDSGSKSFQEALSLIFLNRMGHLHEKIMFRI